MWVLPGGRIRRTVSLRSLGDRPSGRHGLALIGSVWRHSCLEAPCPTFCAASVRDVSGFAAWVVDRDTPRRRIAICGGVACGLALTDNGFHQLGCVLASGFDRDGSIWAIPEET
jgi:hypothetical protein